MALTFEDVFDVGGTEKNGQAKTLRRQGRVNGLQSSTPDGYVNEVLSSADAAIPQPGSTVTVNGTTLTLASREVSIGNDSPLGGCLLTLSYEADDASSGATSGEVKRGGRSSLRQIRTPIDRDGNTIKATYSSDGNAQEQTGEISVFVPQVSPYIETIETTSDPDALAEGWVGRVNSSTYNGSPSGQWIVASVSWEEHGDQTSGKYRFRWEFQKAESSEGWLPIIAYRDPVTKEIPSDVTLSNGLTAIPYYLEKDFNTKF